MSTLKLRKWDSAEYLKTEEDMADYLGACFQEAGNDAAFIAKALERFRRLDPSAVVEPPCGRMTLRLGSR